MKIERKEYLDKIIALKDKQIIKVVTGVRRCGKSTLLEQFQEYLRNNGVTDEQIIAVNLEDYDYEELYEPIISEALSIFAVNFYLTIDNKTPKMQITLLQTSKKVQIIIKTT